METLNKLLDWIYYGLLEPFFVALANGFNFILLKPMEIMHLPVAMQVIIIATLTALLSFKLRRLLHVDSQDNIFRSHFKKKRKQQDNIKYITDWKSRDALYRTMDQELDDDFNTYLAQRYFRYVSTYLLPIFLVLAWLNNFFSGNILNERFGSHHILPLKIASIDGLTVTGVFLIAYIVALVAGFQIKKHLRSIENKEIILQSS